MSSNSDEVQGILVFRTVPSNSPEVDGPYEPLIGAVRTEAHALRLCEKWRDAGVRWENMPFTGPPPAESARSILVAVQAGAHADTARMSPSPITLFSDVAHARAWMRRASEPAVIWEIPYGYVDTAYPEWPLADVGPD